MKAISKKLFGWLMALAMVMTFSFGTLSPPEAEAASTMTTVQPVVVTTGDAITGNSYSAASVVNEKSYTLDDLKALAGDNASNHVYSTINTYDTMSVYRGQGVELNTLLNGVDTTNTKITVVPPGDTYKTIFDPNQTTTVKNGGAVSTPSLGTVRYFYPQFNQSNDQEGGKEAVNTIISWSRIGIDGLDIDESYDVPAISALPESTGVLKLMTGQVAPNEQSNPAWNGNSSTKAFNVIAGDENTETVLTIGNKTYTRAEVLMMARADNEYTYETSNGSATDYVRGVPMSVLLDGYDGDDVVTFAAADGYDVAATSYTVQQLIDNDYMLAYEKGTSASDLAGIYETAKKDSTKYGFFRLYGSDENGKPAKLVNKITVTSSSGTDFSTSPYKHITYDGAPYNIDSITGATLTVEGPGVKKSVPVSVRDLEGRNAGAKRADYTDKREGSNVTRKYEGIELYYILHNMQSGDSGIQMTDNAKIVQIKNRNRQTIAQFTTDQIDAAHETDNPILVAYGTAYTNESKISPFVFDNGNGADKALGNEDGCMKLVYDKSKIEGDENDNYTTFGNMAYIYVAEASTPGYKHDKDPYQSPDISNYVLTVTGEKIGREVNYTVNQLEDMVIYGDNGAPDNNGMGYRDEYSLANSTYWYVNEYEGVQLWKLLLKSGLDPSFADDDETLVSSTATDGYPSTDKFTTKQVADPDSFGFYEKNPADQNDGTYEGDESIRHYNDDGSYTGDKLRTGYPVLVAYGVNGYPYVENSKQDGYLSGLQNDGGPLRVISGKKNYSHPNGSNQAKYLDKILVGDNTYHYSTHKYSDQEVYTGMADNELSVKILNGSDADAPEIKNETYTIGDIEDLIYGGDLTSAELKEAKVKTFYQLTKGSNAYSDLYEGVDLNYFLKNVVELPGNKGTITFSNGTQELTLSLQDVLATTNGSNTETDMNGLSPVLAYGKNGSPLVLDKTADGYVNNVTLAEGTDYVNEITVKNDGGPLAVLFPHTDTDVSDQSLTNVTSITINLSADRYAHTSAPYDTYKDDTLTISGEGTRLGTEGKDFKVSELEGKQTLAFTGDYSILKSGEDQTFTQARYRGIDLYQLLTSSSVGLKSNADKVIVTTTDNQSKEFTLSEIRAKYMNSVTGDTDLPVILAYGAGKAGDDDEEDGLPLVAEKTDEGYDNAYGNNGGPFRLVVGQTDAADVNSGKNMKFIKSINVTASEMVSWNHSASEVFRQYLDETLNLTVVDQEDNELFNKDYTVEEIEAKTDLVERTEAMTTQTDTWEGVNFWRFVKQEVGTAADITDPISIVVTAEDGYYQEIRAKFSMDAFNNGIKDGTNYVPILLGYGVNGYPLAIGDKSHTNREGYDATVGNNGGPIRLITHKSQGTCLTYLKKIKITVGESAPPEDADFTIKGLESGDVTMSIDDIRALKNKAGDSVGEAEAEFTSKSGTELVKGAYLKNILAAQDVEVETTGITLNTPDSFEETERGASYKGITLKQAIDQNYFLAYQVWDADANDWVDIEDTVKDTDIVTNLRMYRKYCEANGLVNTEEWLNRCTNITAVTLDLPEVTKFKEYPTNGITRSTAMDPDGNLWAGTDNGGLYEKKAGASGWDPILTKTSTPAIFSNYTTGVAADDQSGIWFTQNDWGNDYQDAKGVIYYKDGQMTNYLAGSDPETLPENYVQFIKIGPDGKVWFSTLYSGVTVYDPATEEWNTFNKTECGFPATSVNPVECDSEGGAWLGFYPEGPTDGTYTGGFCHMDAEGNVDYSRTLEGDQFSSVWVRDFEIDQNGKLWVICGGSNMDGNVGGMIYVLDGDELTSYTGNDLFGDYLGDGEVRLLTIDPEGAFWFGTYSGGILKVDDPTITDGKMTVSAQYSKGTGSWSQSSMDNVYSIDFYNNGTAYAGTAGGVMVLGEEPAGSKETTGDATADTADLTVDGDGASRNGYFSIRGLKNTDGLNKIDATYSWMNKGGTTGENTFQGAYLDNLFEDVIGLEDDARSFTVIASGGKSKKFDVSMIHDEDKDGNKPMIAWKQDGENVDLTLVIGQKDENDKNKSNWIGGVKEIRIDLATDLEKAQDAALQEIQNYADPLEYTPDARGLLQAAIDTASADIMAAETVDAVTAALADGKAAIDDIAKKDATGDVTADDAALIIDGDGAVQNGYFSIRGLKNAEDLNKIDATYSWMNKGGTTGENAFQGAYLDNLLKDVIGLDVDAYSVTFTAAEGYSKTFDISMIDTEDKDGHKPMIAWKQDGENVDLTLVIGQKDENDKNKSSWIGNIKEIRVDLATDLQKAQKSAIEEISSYADPASYDEEDQDALASAVSAAIDAISNAETVDDVMQALSAGKAAIDSIPTAQDKARLATAKTVIAQKLMTAKDLSLYREEQRNELIDILTEALSAVYEANDLDTLMTLYNDTITAIDAVKTDQQLKDEVAIETKTITLSKKSYVYNGKVKKPTVTVKSDTGTLVKGTDYTVTYSNNKNAGTAKVTVTGIGTYTGSKTVKFKITKAKQPLTVKPVAKTVNYSKVKKAKKVVSKAIIVKNNKGKISYLKKGGSKKLTINKKTGKITVKKGTKKGTYKIKVRVKAAATANYKAKTKTVTVKIRVK